MIEKKFYLSFVLQFEIEIKRMKGIVSRFDILIFLMVLFKILKSTMV